VTSAVQRDLRVARVIDRDVAPLWHDRFARFMFQDLPLVDEGIVLDAAAGTGRTTIELLARYRPSVRVVALESDPASLELARARIGTHFRSRVYLKQGDPTSVTTTADDTYAAAFANLVLGETPEPERLLAELVRVVRPGGEVRATLPLRGTWAEVEDLLYEVLLQTGAADAVRRLSRLARLRPTGPALADRLRAVGIDGDHVIIEQKRMQLVFLGGREFLFAPAVEHGPLRLWKAIVGPEHEPQKVFWSLKEAIDAYFAGRVFCVTVVVGCVRVEVPRPGAPPLAHRVFEAYPTLSRLFFKTSAEGEEEFDLDLDIEIDEGAPEDELEASFAELGREMALSEPSGEEGEATAEVLEALGEVAAGEDIEEIFEDIGDELQLLADDEDDKTPTAPVAAPPADRPKTLGRLGAVAPPSSRPPPPPPRRAPPPPPTHTMRMRKPPPPPPPRGKKKPR